MKQAVRWMFLAALLVSCVVRAQSAAIDIPAQPLSESLKQLGRQSGLQIFFAPELVAGKAAPAVRGQMQPLQALDALLKGSGVEYVQSGSSVTLRRTAVPAQGEQQLPEVKVRAAADPGELPKPYAGGQVARGGRLGILGNRDLMDAPFNQSSYTAELLQNQQTRFVADVLDNDPSARANSPSTGFDGFNIRGFAVGNQDILFNGLPGIAPSFFNSVMAESYERIEVIKGPNALLNGFMQGGSVGGAINVVPKRAGADPLTQLTAGYISDSQLGVHADVGRRFGRDQELGIRLNAVYRDGDTPIDRQSRRSELLTLALDYTTQRVRVSADLGYQEQDLKGARRPYNLATTVTSVPAAPDNRTNAFDPSEFSNPKVYYGMLAGELDLTERWTVFAAAGGSERRHLSHGGNRTIVNDRGDTAAGTFFNFSTGITMVQRIAETGVRGRFDTGPARHEVVLAYTAFNNDRRDTPGAATPIAFPPSNIYNPVFGPPTDVSTLQGLGEVTRTSETDLSSTTIADTVSFFDQRLQIILGARSQEVDITNFNATTGAVSRTYQKKETTPMLGVVVKPRKNVSVYGNYIEGLQQGPTAPAGTVNAGEIFPPAVTEQRELGVKADFGRLGTTLALYEISQPSGLTDPTTNVFAVDGEQRHRGIDFNVYGEIWPGLRVLGGAAYIDAELTSTQGGVNDGKTAPGVPEWRLVMGGEWDTPFAEGLTLTARVVHNSSPYVNAANTLTVPAWTRLDLGARYRLRKNVVLRAGLFNALDEDYWEAFSTQIYQNEPRTLSLSATIDF